MPANDEMQNDLIDFAAIFKKPESDNVIQFRRVHVCPNSGDKVGETHDGKLVEIDSGQEY